jgi:hypothetical protein
MKKNILQSLVFGFLFSGSVQAMEPSEEDIKYVEEYMLAQLIPNSAPLSPEAQEWAFRWNKDKDVPLSNLSYQELITKRDDCLIPVQKVLFDSSFRKRVVDISLDKDEADANRILMGWLMVATEDKIDAIEAELERRDAETANLKSDTSTEE